MTMPDFDTPTPAPDAPKKPRRKPTRKIAKKAVKAPKRPRRVRKVRSAKPRNSPPEMVLLGRDLEISLQLMNLALSLAPLQRKTILTWLLNYKQG